MTRTAWPGVLCVAQLRLSNRSKEDDDLPGPLSPNAGQGPQHA